MKTPQRTLLRDLDEDDAGAPAQRHPLEHSQPGEGTRSEPPHGPSGVESRWPQAARVKGFKLSNGPLFVEKLVDLVGLYRNPPEQELVLSVDEKTQIQALDRTQKSLPMYKGGAQTMTHDYTRNGRTTLFAALELVHGRVISECTDRHRHQEWIRFLKVIDRETPTHLDVATEGKRSQFLKSVVHLE